MAATNIFKIEGTRTRSLREVLDYVVDFPGHVDKNCRNPIPFFTGFGVNPYKAYEDMMALQNYYNVGHTKRYLHFEVSLRVSGNLQTYFVAFYRIGEALFSVLRAQIFLAVHVNKMSDTGAIHCHYIVNNVCIDTGKKIHVDLRYLYALTDVINGVLVSLQIPPVNVPRNVL